MDPNVPRDAKPRKKKGQPHRGDNAKKKVPGLSARLKELWKDPVWAAETMRKRAESQKRSGKTNSRAGIPDGMWREEAEAVWAVAKEKAKQNMADLKAAGFLGEDDEKAQEALEVSLTIMRSPLDAKVKLQAARTVLEWTKAKPASKSIVAVDEAEAWLNQISESDAGQGEASTYA